MKKTLLLLCLVASFSMFAQDPVVQNATFDEIPKNSGSDCACAHWMNKDLGDQGETSGSGLEEGNTAIKFDNLEADLMYQEVAVLANTEYKLTYALRINDDVDPDIVPSSFEMRILKGSGYEAGYTPVYYTDATEKPSSGFGYTDFGIAALPANIMVGTLVAYPGNEDFNVLEFTFTTGTETSIAIMGRGVGRPNTAPADGKPYSWSSGEDEIRVDYLTLTNQSDLSTQDFFASNLRIYPNPAKTNITVKSTDQTQIDSVELYSVLGLRVLKTTNLVNDTLDVSEMATGVYLLKVNAGNSSVTKRIVIE